MHRDQMKRRSSPAYQIWAIGALVPASFICWSILTRNSASDFACFWVAGKMALAGNAAAAYDPALIAAAGKTLVGNIPVAYIYPPPSFFMFMPFALLPYVAATLLWNFLTAALFVVAARPWLPKGFPALLVILTPAALLNIFFGQSGLLFGALWLFAFRGLSPAASLLTFKPHLAILAVLTLRNPKRFAWAAATLLGLVLASALVFGFNVWTEFFGHAINYSGRIGHRFRWLFAGVSPAIAYGLVGWAFYAICAGIFLRKRFNAFTAATAALLISPYGFHYDLVVSSLGFGLIIFAEWDEMTILRRLAIAIGFLAPVIAIAGAWWAPPSLLFGLWAQTTGAIPKLLDAVASQPGKPIRRTRKPDQIGTDSSQSPFSH